MKLQGKRGAGAFQWNRGGWFGGQVGATLWLAILGFVLLAQSQAVGALPVALAVLANLVGVLLWRRRWSLAPYPAMQALIVVCGIAAGLAILGVRAAGLELSEVGLPSAWFLLMYPGLNLFFYRLERSFKKAAA